MKHLEIMTESLRILISGGGTGGHIYPAISIAHAIAQRHPKAEIAFVGALGRMEMHMVPDAGYPITGIPIAGFQRKAMHKNLSLPFKLVKSLWSVWQIIRSFKPHAVVGTGGYVSGPTLKVAQLMGIPTLIQEQNSFAGKTNRMLAAKAQSICVAYPGMEKVFPSERIHFSGNPIRPAIAAMADQPCTPAMRSEAKTTMGLDPDKALVLVLGGSQGARAINQAVETSESLWLAAGHQILWQCGKFYHEDLSQRLPQQSGRQLKAFLKDMPTAYRAADVIISRAGAGTLSELAAVAAAAILIPSPNVAEDHQSHNARSLSEQGAALLLPENDVDGLGNMVMELLADSAALDGLRSAALRLAKPHASNSIVQQLEGLLS